MVVFGGQLVCGLCFAYASTYFFQQVGLNTEDAYSLGVGANGLALFACFCNWFLLMPYFGRRTVYVIGMAAMATELCIIGILNPWTHISSVAWTQAVLTLVWTFTFQLSAGQLGWALPAEIGSTRLRQKTVCLARNVSNITGVIGGTLENYMVSLLFRLAQEYLLTIRPDEPNSMEPPRLYGLCVGSLRLDRLRLGIFPPSCKLPSFLYHYQH